jgi:uncharacterized membrane protein
VSNGFAKATAWLKTGASRGAVTTVATIGAVAAGAALIEAALVPGLAVGAAALLAPKVFRAVRRSNLTKTRWVAAASGTDIGARLVPSETQPSLWSTMSRLRPGRTLMKTVTFRVVVTALDFSANYIIIGELATAAGLSAFSFVAGPVFYFLHEAGWNYFGDRLQARDLNEHAVFIGFPMSQALAKTITYRTVTTISEFSVNYIVVQNLATAALLSSFGFVLGPFVYFAHERAWEMLGDPEKAAAPLLALPNPTAVFERAG